MINKLKNSFPGPKWFLLSFATFLLVKVASDLCTFVVIPFPWWLLFPAAVSLLLFSGAFSGALFKRYIPSSGCWIYSLMLIFGLGLIIVSLYKPIYIFGAIFAIGCLSALYPWGKIGSFLRMTALAVTFCGSCFLLSRKFPQYESVLLYGVISLYLILFFFSGKWKKMELVLILLATGCGIYIAGYRKAGMPEGGLRPLPENFMSEYLPECAAFSMMPGAETISVYVISDRVVPYGVAFSTISHVKQMQFHSLTPGKIRSIVNFDSKEKIDLVVLDVSWQEPVLSSLFWTDFSLRQIRDNMSTDGVLAAVLPDSDGEAGRIMIASLQSVFRHVELFYSVRTFVVASDRDPFNVTPDALNERAKKSLRFKKLHLPHDMLSLLFASRQPEETVQISGIGAKKNRIRDQVLLRNHLKPYIPQSFLRSILRISDSLVCVGIALLFVIYCFLRYAHSSKPENKIRVRSFEGSFSLISCMYLACMVMQTMYLTSMRNMLPLLGSVFAFLLLMPMPKEKRTVPELWFTLLIFCLYFCWGLFMFSGVRVASALFLVLIVNEFRLEYQEPLSVPAFTFGALLAAICYPAALLFPNGILIWGILILCLRCGRYLSVSRSIGLPC